MFPIEVRNCGVPGPRAPRRVRFDFACPRRWETLAPTEDPDVRACDACARPVFRCHTLEEADAHALQGDCIAVTPDLADQAREPEPGMWIGTPSRLEW